MAKRNLTINDTGILLLRVLTGFGIAWHGYSKIFIGSMDSFIEAVAEMGFIYPTIFAWVAALSEFAGGLCIALGLWTRLAAVMVFFTMTVAAFIRHGNDPFDQKELALLYWTVSGALICMGGGKFSLDHLYPKKRRRS